MALELHRGGVDRPRVVIVGGGFGGLWAARALRRARADVVVIDRQNGATTEVQTGGPDVVAAAHAGADSMAPDQHDGGEF